MKEKPELSVRMFLDIQRGSDTSAPDELVRKFLYRFRTTEWPEGAPLPQIYYDPRALSLNAKERAALHAKCVVVDGIDVFVSSANFTEAARNSSNDQAKEAEINEQIVKLWSAQKDQAATARRTREELKSVRAQLSERLHQMKSLLVKSGRGGRWTSYLREHRIPRATADRYVNQHESTLAPLGENRLTEAIPLPTEDVVRTFFDKMLPRLQRALPNQEAVFLFVCELVIGLPGVKGDVTDEGAVIFRPAEDAVVTASVEDTAAKVLVAV